MCRGPAGRESTCAQGPSGEFSGAGARPGQGQEPGERAVAGHEGLCAQQAVNQEKDKAEGRGVMGRGLKRWAWRSGEQVNLEMLWKSLVYG